MVRHELDKALTSQAFTALHAITLIRNRHLKAILCQIDAALSAGGAHLIIFSTIPLKATERQGSLVRDALDYCFASRSLGISISRSVTPMSRPACDSRVVA